MVNIFMSILGREASIYLPPSRCPFSLALLPILIVSIFNPKLAWANRHKRIPVCTQDSSNLASLSSNQINRLLNRQDSPYCHHRPPRRTAACKPSVLRRRNRRKSQVSRQDMYLQSGHIPPFRPYQSTIKPPIHVFFFCFSCFFSFSS